MKQLNGKKGSIVLLALFALAGSLTLSTVGLSRSVTEVGISNIITNKGRAFNSAEAAFNTALKDARLMTANKTAVEALLKDSNGQCPSATAGQFLINGYPMADTIRIINNPSDPGGACTDSDYKVIVVAKMTNNGVKQELRSLVELPGSVPSFGSFDKALAVGRLHLNGSQAMIGSGEADGSGLVSMYIGQGPDQNTPALETEPSNRIWAREIDFRNTFIYTLDDLCEHCNYAGNGWNTGVYPDTGPISARVLGPHLIPQL